MSTADKLVRIGTLVEQDLSAVKCYYREEKHCWGKTAGIKRLPRYQSDYTANMHLFPAQSIVEPVDSWL